MMKILMSVGAALLLTQATLAPAEAKDVGHAGGPGRHTRSHHRHGYRGEHDHRVYRGEHDQRVYRGYRSYRDCRVYNNYRVYGENRAYGENRDYGDYWLRYLYFCGYPYWNVYDFPYFNFS